MEWAGKMGRLTVPSGKEGVEREGKMGTYLYEGKRGES